ncbi:Hypothetical protein CINCED_3A020818, partial [Cinara cedri]
MCHGSASNSRNELNNFVTSHNHGSVVIDLYVPFIRDTLGERVVDLSVEFSSKTLYQRNYQ